MNNRKWALVLGCSTGVGAATAFELACRGYNIFGVHRGRHKDDVWQLNDRIHAQGVEFEHIVRDCTTPPSAPTFGWFPSIALVVHSLAGASTGSTWTANVEKTFAVMAHSLLWWIHALSDSSVQKLDTGASILAFSNPVVDFHLQNTGVIGPAKAALEGYVRVLAAELRGRARVNALRFSTVLTPALRQVLPPAAVDRLDAIHREIIPASGRMQTVEEIAKLAADILTGCPTLNGAVIDGTAGGPMMLLDYAFNRSTPKAD